MKKILVMLVCFLFGASSYAYTTRDVKSFFNSFVAAANSYDPEYFDYYTQNSVVKRVVVKRDGTTKTVVVPMSEFRRHSALQVGIGKLRHYKNFYSNIRIMPEGSDFKVVAMRRPSTSSYSLPAYFIIGEDSSGKLKIKEESMHTKVQSFLRER